MKKAAQRKTKRLGVTLHRAEVHVATPKGAAAALPAGASTGPLLTLRLGSGAFASGMPSDAQVAIRRMPRAQKSEAAAVAERQAEKKKQRRANLALALEAGGWDRRWSPWVRLAVLRCVWRDAETWSDPVILEYPGYAEKLRAELVSRIPSLSELQGWFALRAKDGGRGRIRQTVKQVSGDIARTLRQRLRLGGKGSIPQIKRDLKWFYLSERGKTIDYIARRYCAEDYAQDRAPTIPRTRLRVVTKKGSRLRSKRASAKDRVEKAIQRARCLVEVFLRRNSEVGLA